MSARDVILDVRDLRKVYRTPSPLGRGTEFVAVEGASFQVERGETFGLIGESGSGKTTVGRMLLRLLEATSGYVEFDGYEVLRLAGPRLRELRQRMQIVFQDSGSAFNPRLPVGEQVAFPMRKFRLHPEKEIREGSRSCWSTSGCRATRPNAIRTSSPAGSASGSGSPGRSRRSRTSWSWTNRRPRSTCPCRARSSTCSATCRRSAGSP